MQAIRRILVSVDLSRCHPLASSTLGPNINACIDTGISLAEAFAAELQLFTVFNWTEDSMHHLDPDDRSEVKRTFEEEAHQLLDELAGRARVRDIRAHGKLVLGKPWQETVREVVRGGHDLLVVGPHEPNTFFRFIGDTTVTLLRTCPCPVWVARPGSSLRNPNILVATDLEPGSEVALKYGLVLGQALGGKIDVVHVAICRVDELGWSSEPDPEVKIRHEELRRAAEKSLNAQVDAALQRLGKTRADLGDSLLVQLAEDVGNPAHVLEQLLETRCIDLLVIGSTAPHGLTGLLIGNTSEQLLPGLKCSLLAVKDLDFKSPISLDAVLAER